MNEPIFQWRTVNGEPTTVGHVMITLQAQALSIRLPFGGFVWNRPAAVLVEENGRTERIPIMDITRLIVLAAAGLSTAVTILSRRKKE
ncbi:MAG: hypothetical protein GY803_06530 [Chloroflexi bacterium]|nr:hypothetical protein [Chloroflexota bacterium]